mmetsp:Transcript_16398/g.53438  ORF Transcript_16398/g.53438 Transcript_16398/m.53438 type:complete len:213 (+) Transcript_16398:193-831(+)
MRRVGRVHHLGGRRLCPMLAFVHGELDCNRRPLLLNGHDVHSRLWRPDTWRPVGGPAVHVLFHHHRDRRPIPDHLDRAGLGAQPARVQVPLCHKDGVSNGSCGPGWRWRGRFRGAPKGYPILPRRLFLLDRHHHFEQRGLGCRIYNGGPCHWLWQCTVPLLGHGDDGWLWRHWDEYAGRQGVVVHPYCGVGRNARRLYRKGWCAPRGPAQAA